MKGSRKRAIEKFIDYLSDNPFDEGDFVEADQDGRPIFCKIVRDHAITYFPDHAVKEIKVIELQDTLNTFISNPVTAAIADLDTHIRHEKSNRLETLKNDLMVGLEQVEKGEFVNFTISEVEKIKHELHEEAQ